MKQKSKIIIFSYDFPPSNGGIARLCQEIAVGIQPYYDKVIVLTRNKKGISIPYNSDLVEIKELAPERIKCEIEAFLYLSKVKNKEDYTILCGLWHPEAFLSIVSGFKNVYILGHGTEFLSGSSNFRKNFWLKIYANFVLKKAKKTICNSHYTQGLVNKITPKASTAALPLAVNHLFFEKVEVYKDSKLKLCTVSRVDKFKGHDFIAKTIASLPIDIRRNIEWNIAGTGPDLDYIKQIVIDYNIAETTIFHGFVKDEELPLFYNKNDIFILCSREDKNVTTVEGFGLVFLEAQSCGIPVIGTKTGGIPDAINSGNGGWLIEQDNISELHNLLTHLYQNRNIIEEMGVKARKRVLEKSTFNYYCKELFKLLS